LHTITKIIGQRGHAIGIECLKLHSMKFDQEGGLRLDPIIGSEYVLEADTVILAIGQRVIPSIVSDNQRIEISRRIQ